MNSVLNLGHKNKKYVLSDKPYVRDDWMNNFIQIVKEHDFVILEIVAIPQAIARRMEMGNYKPIVRFLSEL